MPSTHITSVVAHIDHGKTTLIDSLLITQQAVCRQLAGDLRYLDTRIDEQSRGITLKLTAINIKTPSHHLTIIDTPGHIDFESLVQSSALLSDSFILLVDVCEGILPRLLAITKYINSNTVLVLNKIDKIESEKLYNVVIELVGRINSLIGKDLFDWEKNNVVLAWSTMCFGMCYETFGKIGKVRNLKNCVMFFNKLKSCVDSGNIEKIVKRFNVKGKNSKNIYMGVFPLWETLFSCIDIFKSVDRCRNEILSGLTVFAVLNNTKILERKNLLFATRLFSGTIRINDTVISKNSTSQKLCIVKGIYCFDVNGYIPMEYAEAPCLVLIESDFLKQSRIYGENENNLEYNLEIRAKPSYKTRVTLNNDEGTRFKEAILTLSFLESVFKVKINVNGEYEFSTEGKVHFEKIWHDLTENNFLMSICEPEMRFCETAGKFYSDNEIFIGKITDNMEEIKSKRKDKIYSELNKNVEISNDGSDINSKILNRKDKNIICKKITEPNKIIEKEINYNDNELISDINKINIRGVKSTKKNKNRVETEENKHRDKNCKNKAQKSTKSRKYKDSEISNMKESLNNNLKNMDFKNKINLNEKIKRDAKLNHDQTEKYLVKSKYSMNNCNSANVKSMQETNEKSFKEDRKYYEKRTEISNENLVDCDNFKNERIDSVIKKEKYKDNNIPGVNVVKSDFCNVDMHFKTNEIGVYNFNRSSLKNIDIQDKFCKEEGEKAFYKKDSNILYFYKNKYEDIIKNVFEYFLQNGPLINGKVMFTKVEILINTKQDEIIDLFQNLKNKLINIYHKTDPYIIPDYFACTIQLLSNHLGLVYHILHKYNSVVQEETYEAETDFYVIKILIPQFVYYSFVESIKKKTQGTAYLEFVEYGFYDIKSDIYKDMINEIRKKKGMFVEEKIVIDPEKQRTLKK